MDVDEIDDQDPGETSMAVTDLVSWSRSLLFMNENNENTASQTHRVDREQNTAKRFASSGI